MKKKTEVNIEDLMRRFHWILETGENGAEAICAKYIGWWFFRLVKDKSVRFKKPYSSHVL